jgi:hypothetical protein
MHELLAVCLWVLDRDSLLPPSSDDLTSPLAREILDDAMRTTLDRRYIEHDAYEVFGKIMKSAKTFYEWRAEEVPVSHRLDVMLLALAKRLAVRIASQSSANHHEMSTYSQ